MVSLTPASQAYLSTPFEINRQLEEPPCATSYYARIASTIQVLSQLTSSSVGFQYISRVITSVARIVSPIVRFPELVHTCASMDNFVAALRVIHDGKYFLGPQLEQAVHEGCWLSIWYNIAFSLSDSLASLDYLNDLDIVSLAEIGTSMGQVSIFGIAPLKPLLMIPFTPFMVYTALVGYLLMAADTFLLIQNGDSSTLTTLLLARSVSEIALKTFILTSGAFLATAQGLVVWGLLGAIAASLAVATVYYARP